MSRLIIYPESINIHAHFKWGRSKGTETPVFNISKADVSEDSTHPRVQGWHLHFCSSVSMTVPSTFGPVDALGLRGAWNWIMCLEEHKTQELLILFPCHSDHFSAYDSSAELCHLHLPHTYLNHLSLLLNLMVFPAPFISPSSPAEVRVAGESEA